MFKDDKGNFSSMRVYSLIALGVAMFLTFKGTEIDVLLLWLVAAFAPKAVQKFAERGQPKLK